MLRKSIAWHHALSSSGKVAVWSVVAAITIIMFAAAGATQLKQPADSTTPRDQAAKLQSYIEDVTALTPIPFDKQTVQDPSIAKGETKVMTAGVAGLKTSVYAVTYINGVETKRNLKTESITTLPIAEVTAVGTYVAPAAEAVAPVSKPRAPMAAEMPTKCDPNYTPCIQYVAHDLNCPDIGRRVQVVGQDHYRLDADHDGVGCESYQ